MENKLFACEMEGCFDSAVYDIKFLEEPNNIYQVCESCFHYWKTDEETILIGVEKINV